LGAHPVINQHIFGTEKAKSRISRSGSTGTSEKQEIAFRGISYLGKRKNNESEQPNPKRDSENGNNREPSAHILLATRRKEAVETQKVVNRENRYREVGDVGQTSRF
jgi:hypothetical protein